MDEEIKKEFEELKDKVQAGSMMKLGVVVLWMISRKDMHGYEIVKVLNEDLMVRTATTSRIYPLLSEMENNGLISQKEIKDGKRKKKVYNITKKGKVMLMLTKKYVKEMMKKKIMKDYVRWLMG